MAKNLTQQDKSLADLIGRTALRVARTLPSSEGDELTRVVGRLALLNQAQMLVGVDNKMARRLKEKADSQG